jgi:rfaE bifunctional protein nucleotidyltransferase chain/domain/rfaE bifunctional protein kinase chain/domain
VTERVAAASTGRLVIIGDTLLDRDVDGSVTRIAPDAPAPVLDEAASVDRPGGAGLAALFAAGHGYDVVLITALADDAGGARLAELLAAAGITVHGLPCTGATAEKVRLRADGRVLLRLDRGGRDGEIPGDPSEAALAELAGAVAVLVSDYGRGVARQSALRTALAGVTAPVVWDPHPRGPAAVAGARLVTPNEGELRGLTGVTAGGRLAAAAQGAVRLRGLWRTGAVAVTLGADGALLSHAAPTPLVVPAPARATGDTCGAGDRFAAAATVALARGALVSEAVREAVAEATGYVAGGGTASVLAAPADRARVGAEAAGAVVAGVRARGGTVVATGGCFDLLHAGHVATLEAARRLGDCLIVCLNSDASVGALKGPGRPVVNQTDRGRLLAALECVDAVVVFDETTPHTVLSWLRPDVWVKGGDYSGGSGEPYDLPEAELVSRWGGQTVVVPYLTGRSTTGMIAAARSGGGSERGGESR